MMDGGGGGDGGGGVKNPGRSVVVDAGCSVVDVVVMSDTGVDVSLMVLLVVVSISAPDPSDVVVRNDSGSAVVVSLCDGSPFVSIFFVRGT